MTLKQIRSTDGTGTLTYLMTDGQSGKGLLIDPNIQDLAVIGSLAAELGVQITHVVDTHTHADHVSGAGEIRRASGAEVFMHSATKDKWKIVDQGDAFGIGDILRANAKIPVDHYIDEGDVLTVGSLSLTTLFTPGHTNNHVAMLAGENLFTGDLLLIGQAGRSDLPGGNPEQQYDSLMNKILPLPDTMKMWPGHDYEDNTFSSLGDEKKTNPFLQRRTRAEYVEFVKDFFPPFAEATAEGGAVTLQCGVKRVAQPQDKVKSMSVTELAALLEKGNEITLLDVREPFELERKGALEGVLNIPVGQLPLRLGELPDSKERTIVCVCQTGSRSYEATHYLSNQGYRNVINLDGGTSAWVRAGHPVVRPNSTMR